MSSENYTDQDDPIVAAKPSRGRPYAKEGEKGRKVTVYMAPEIEKWLRAQHGGMSRAIAALVERAKSAK